MKPHHHPDASSLMSYAAGSLPDALATVVACHVAVCEQCQQAVAEAEQLGHFLMEQQQQTELSAHARNDIISMLDAVEQSEPEQPASPVHDEGDIPLPLRPYLGDKLDSLHWKTMAPGIRQFIIPTTKGRLRLLKIAPGTSMPIHGHSGSELTMVLRGSYGDEVGRFQAGDVADLDPEIYHQPATDTHEDCICLIATDAPLKFTGLVPRILQPFFQL
ncbi:ChrR family anti-sigma-E factor [Sansalvadorimonas verongulae]|uniref:ChrR family anti-sigma-E factor n=1 Tax=Sansalvadorimonas verongulae TaxID=2172824 RepID=UPI0012BBFEB5|nr:ChrR family anti-sigma-E factor [Sansalvadorimonas verongulae]MTI14726.1 transcriptional regulator [Sansalvadorimonas verongulae]